MQARLQRNDLVEPELSYRIVGALFQAYNEVGPGLQEKHYQRAIAAVLRAERIAFREQVSVPLVCVGTAVGRYFLDFLIAERVVLEIKRGDHCSPEHIAQANAVSRGIAPPARHPRKLWESTGGVSSHSEYRWS